MLALYNVKGHVLLWRNLVLYVEDTCGGGKWNARLYGTLAYNLRYINYLYYLLT